MVPRLGMWLNFWANSTLAVLTRCLQKKACISTIFSFLYSDDHRNIGDEVGTTRYFCAIPAL